MSSPLIATNNNLIIQTDICFELEDLKLEVISYLGQFTTDVYSFQVKILPPDNSSTSSQLGLLRVGGIESGLQRELQLREILSDYKMITELLAYTTAEYVTINLDSSKHQPQQQDNQDLADIVNSVDSESDYLEEEYYPEQEIIPNSSTSKLILITPLPEVEKTLETWLKTKHSLEESLLITSQVCQFLRYVHQRHWCIISLLPQFMEMGTPMQVVDLTNAYPEGEILTSGLLGNYCAPELAYGKNPIDESMSSYTVAALLYHVLHQKTLAPEESIDITINPIPGIYQILQICLSPIPETRFPLQQLLSILVANRQEFSKIKIQWDIANNSTVGLAINRLQNEDNYGVKQQQTSNAETMILAVVADGMGGMSQGEVASKLAVQIVLEEPLTPNIKTPEQRHQWLISLFHKVNESVASHVKDGGTTLSVILAINEQLMIAHVGDSRIYLLRQGEIHQLSEDHSLIGILLASGQITADESINHPDRNVLTKFIGAKQRLSDGYVQDLRRTNSELSMQLQNEDILLLCSDGVWDLVSQNELEEIFANHQNLQLAVDQTIIQVLERGASDNATILALKCRKGGQDAHPTIFM
jgi:PPM family protein phosphatase